MPTNIEISMFINCKFMYAIRCHTHLKSNFTFYVNFYTKRAVKKSVLRAFIHFRQISTPRTGGQCMLAVHSTPHLGRHPTHSTNFDTAHGGSALRPPVRSGSGAARSTAVLPASNEKAIKLPASCFGSPVSLMALYAL